MTTPIRFAILTAVSTVEQATDKASLEIQETTCRNHARAHGWVETAGPFVIPGNSRTKYLELSTAEADIPELKAAIDSAESGEFDVLCIFDWSRLRELGEQVTRLLASFGVQIYATASPPPIDPPEQFRLKRKPNTTALILQRVGGLSSSLEIDSMSRRLQSALRARIPAGLHVGHAPYGYEYDMSAGKDYNRVPLVQVPAEAAVLVRMKDAYLAGQSTADIVRGLNADKIPAPHGGTWQKSSVLCLLRNGFYGGRVILGRTATRVDLRTSKRKAGKGDPARVLDEAGKHEPIWGAETSANLRAEMTRRQCRHKGQRHAQRLSLLLYCAEHGKPMRQTHLQNTVDDYHRAWYCPIHEWKHWHFWVKEREVFGPIVDKLIADLSDIPGLGLDAVDEDATKPLYAALADLRARQTRLLDALESGVLDKALYSERSAGLSGQIETIERQIQQAEDVTRARMQQRAALEQVAETLDTIREFIYTADPVEVNAELRKIIKRIVLSPDGIKIEYLLG